MTELGMALSNTLDRRVPGKVGEPLPNVEVRVVDGADTTSPAVCPGAPRRGPQVFLEYWRRPDETAASFVDGWFRTGDVAAHDPDGYRLLGRSSVDIIKTGGEGVGAGDRGALPHASAIGDCAVVGVADDEWGERVCAAVVGAVAGEASLTTGRPRVGQGATRGGEGPSRFVFVAELPRNTMGKVTKADVKKLFT
jgi:malonyl-CoA/methylmalonyl-CoA synthetase